MKIDKEKMEKIIKEEIEDIKTGIWSSGERCLFDGGDYQIKLVTTADVDDFIEAYDLDDLVITESGGIV